MQTNLKYIIVDDDPFNNMICNMTLKKTLGEVDTKIFTLPEEGLLFIKNNFGINASHTVLFLDINMPILTGWDFLDEYEKFSENVKGLISVYLLSSSIDVHDWEKAKENKHIKGFLVKPIFSETILSIAKKEY